MGQKTHPLGFRLGITQEHKSTWYANLNQYANILKEDDQIRTYIDTISRDSAVILFLSPVTSSSHKIFSNKQACP